MDTGVFYWPRMLSPFFTLVYFDFPFRNHASWTLKLYVLYRAGHIHTYGYIHKYTHPSLGRLHVPGPANQHFPDDIS